MSDKPKLTFGNPTTSADGSQSRFSFTNTSNSLAGPNASSPGSFTFGNTSKPQTENKSAKFSTAGSSEGSLFSTDTKNSTTGGGFFGAATSSAGKSTPALTTTSAPASGFFGSTATMAPPSTAADSSSTPIFGGAKSGQTGLFPPQSSAQDAVSTPTKTLAGDAGSTTPQVAPPTVLVKSGPTAIFGNPPPGPAGLKSGGTGTESSTGKSLFGSTAPTTSAPTANGGFFGIQNPGLFGNATTAKVSEPAATTSTSSAANAATVQSTPTTGTPSLFSNLNNKPAAVAATTTAPATPSIFADTSTAPATTSAPSSTPNLFGGKPADQPASSTTAPAVATTSTAPLTTATTTAATTAATVPATASPAAQPSLFGSSTKPAESSTGGAAASQQNGLSTVAAGNNCKIGASTAGPPSQIPRLKNKTMDEIITRWATDLSKYQKEFKAQAAQVAEWDWALVANGEKIQKLYLSTFEADRASHEIERQLASVESQQDELSSWLDRYEHEVEDITKRLGKNEQIAGPDQERERTYSLAEKLTDRMDELGKDLSKMIKEINDMSGVLSKGSKSDDPLSQIVRVLNGHLSQLQWIDANAADLRAKVRATQNAMGSNGQHYGGPESDNAENFYRSYMGRR